MTILPARPLKLAVPDLVSPSYFPALAAIELGFFAAEGLEVSLERIFPPNRAYEALRDGSVDLVAASAHAALAAFPRWEGVTLVCAQSQGMYWFLVLHAELGASPGDLAALKGRSIGAAPWVELGLKRLVADAGLDPVRDDIRIAPIPPAPAVGPNFGLSAAKALEERRVDGFWANGMAAELAVLRGVGTVIVDARRSGGAAVEHTFASIAAATRLLDEHPGLSDAVVRAMRSTHEALRKDPDLATEVGRRLFPAEEAGLIAGLIARDAPFYDHRISRQAFDGLTRFSIAAGILDTPVPFDAVVAQTLKDGAQ